MDREMDRADRQTYRHIFPHFRYCQQFIPRYGCRKKGSMAALMELLQAFKYAYPWGKKAEWILGGVTSQKNCTCCPHIWHTIVGFNHFYFLPSFQVALFLVIHQLESRTVFFSAEYHQTLGWAPMFTNMCSLKKEGSPKSNVLSLLSLVHHHFHFPLMACYFRACCIPHSVTDLYFEM